MFQARSKNRWSQLDNFLQNKPEPFINNTMCATQNVYFSSKNKTKELAKKVSSFFFTENLTEHVVYIGTVFHNFSTRNKDALVIGPLNNCWVGWTINKHSRGRGWSRQNNAAQILSQAKAEQSKLFLSFYSEFHEYFFASFPTIPQTLFSSIKSFSLLATMDVLQALFEINFDNFHLTNDHSSD